MEDKIEEMLCSVLLSSYLEVAVLESLEVTSCEIGKEVETELN